MEQTKSKWLSKTIWLNSVGLVLTALIPFVPHLEVVQAWVASHIALIGSIWGGLGIVLRFVTKERIKLVD